MTILFHEHEIYGKVLKLCRLNDFSRFNFVCLVSIALYHEQVTRPKPDVINVSNVLFKNKKKTPVRLEGVNPSRPPPTGVRRRPGLRANRHLHVTF